MSAAPLSLSSVRLSRLDEQDVVVLRLPDGAQAVVALQGAQVLLWTDSGGAERLYLSPLAKGEQGVSALRGGVPVCFPQFNQRGDLVKHGFARLLPWRCTHHDAQDGSACVQLTLSDSEQTLVWWPQRFVATLTVTLEPDGLNVQLQVHNPGEAAWAFTGALHTYLRVPQIEPVRLEGLQGCARWDAVRDVRSVQGAQGIGFEGEYDSVFSAPSGPMRLHYQPGSNEVLSIEHSPSWANAVVWNPGAALSARMADMPADGYQHMLCVEAACVDQPVTVQPGAQWTGWQQLRVQAPAAPAA